MKFWKDKEGNELTFKEFIERWKSGIEGLTPEQKLSTQISGTRIMLIGILLGIVMSLFAIKQMWWVIIILIGAFMNTYIQYLGQKEQKKMYERVKLITMQGGGLDGLI